VDGKKVNWCMELSFIHPDLWQFGSEVHDSFMDFVILLVFLKLII